MSGQYQGSWWKSLACSSNNPSLSILKTGGKMVNFQSLEQLQLHLCLEHFGETLRPSEECSAELCSSLAIQNTPKKAFSRPPPSVFFYSKTLPFSADLVEFLLVRQNLSHILFFVFLRSAIFTKNGGVWGNLFLKKKVTSLPLLKRNLLPACWFTRYAFEPKHLASLARIDGAALRHLADSWRDQGSDDSCSRYTQLMFPRWRWGAWGAWGWCGWCGCWLRWRWRRRRRWWWWSSLLLLWWLWWLWWWWW